MPSLINIVRTCNVSELAEHDRSRLRELEYRVDIRYPTTVLPTSTAAPLSYMDQEINLDGFLRDIVF